MVWMHGDCRSWRLTIRPLPDFTQAGNRLKTVVLKRAKCVPCTDENVLERRGRNKTLPDVKEAMIFIITITKWIQMIINHAWPQRGTEVPFYYDFYCKRLTALSNHFYGTGASFLYEMYTLGTLCRRSMCQSWCPAQWQFKSFYPFVMGDYSNKPGHNLFKKFSLFRQIS